MENGLQVLAAAEGGRWSPVRWGDLGQERVWEGRQSLGVVHSGPCGVVVTRLSPKFKVRDVEAQMEMSLVLA